jgi:VWFA-related protein
MKKHILLFLVLLSMFFCLLFGYQKQKNVGQVEEHEVEVRLVLVDVIVTKDGKFVTDLTMDDFEILEDERKIPINSCELISFGKTEIRKGEAESEQAPPAVARKRLVVVFDAINSWLRNLTKGGKQIVDELESLTKLGNEVMVVQISEDRPLTILQPFTTDAELIRKALVKASGRIWFDNSIEAMRMYRDAGLEVEVTNDAGTPEPPASRQFEMSRAYIKQEYVVREKMKFEKTLGEILALTNTIKDLPGKKSILFISDGIPFASAPAFEYTEKDDEASFREISSGIRGRTFRKREVHEARVFDPFNILGKDKLMVGEDVLQELIRFANANNISFYSLYPENFMNHLMQVSTEFAFYPDMKASQDFIEQEKKLKLYNLVWISEDTGGIALRGTDKYDKFKQVMEEDLNHYYLLSYYPRRQNPDDKYHKIKVKVRKGGVDVRSRKGYTDYSEEGNEKMSLVSTYYNPSLFKELPFEGAFIPVYLESGKFEPWICAALPANKLFIQRNIGFGPMKLDLHIWIKDVKKGDRTWGGQIPIPFNINQDFLNAARSTDYILYHFLGSETRLKNEKNHVIYALYDEQTNEVGTWESTLSLPDLREKNRGDVLNCVLGLVAQSPKVKKKSFSLSRADGSLEYGKFRFFPLVTNRIQRSQDTAVFLQIHLPKGKIEVHPQFLAVKNEGAAQQIHGEMLAENWNGKIKVWSGLFHLDLKNIISGGHTVKVEIPVSDSGPVLNKEMKLIMLSY